MAEVLVWMLALLLAWQGVWLLEWLAAVGEAWLLLIVLLLMLLGWLVATGGAGGAGPQRPSRITYILALLPCHARAKLNNLTTGGCRRCCQLLHAIHARPCIASIAPPCHGPFRCPLNRRRRCHPPTHA